MSLKIKILLFTCRWCPRIVWRRASCAFALLACTAVLVLGQQGAAKLQLSTQSVATSRNEPPTEASAGATTVITIKYHCPTESSSTQESGVCSAQVSRKEFDTLVRATDPAMSQDARLSLAAEYARLLILAKEASRRGLDQSAEVRSLEKFSRLQVLASELVKRTTANAPQVPVDEIEHYFHKHVRDYREVALSRVTLPAAPLSDQHSRATASARAAEIQKKAASGEQFSKLQQEVAGSSSEPPSSIVGVILCSSLPEAHRVVCELQPGTVSEVIADKFGYYIYRLDSARDRTLDEVRDEIRAKLQRDRLQSEIEKMRSPISLDLDESYFGKLPSEDVAHQHGMHFPRAKTVRVNDTTATPHPHRH